MIGTEHIENFIGSLAKAGKLPPGVDKASAPLDNKPTDVYSHAQVMHNLGTTENRNSWIKAMRADGHTKDTFDQLEEMLPAGVKSGVDFGGKAEEEPDDSGIDPSLLQDSADPDDEEEEDSDEETEDEEEDTPASRSQKRIRDLAKKNKQNEEELRQYKLREKWDKWQKLAQQAGVDITDNNNVIAFAANMDVDFSGFTPPTAPAKAPKDDKAPTDKNPPVDDPAPQQDEYAKVVMGDMLDKKYFHNGKPIDVAAVAERAIKKFGIDVPAVIHTIAPGSSAIFLAKLISGNYEKQVATIQKMVNENVEGYKIATVLNELNQPPKPSKVDPRNGGTGSGKGSPKPEPKPRDANWIPRSLEEVEEIDDPFERGRAMSIYMRRK